MTHMSRRDLLRGAAAGALIAGWDPISRSWATAADRRRWLDRIPDLDGVLLTDPASRRLAADDYGHFVHHEPVAVLRPASVEDIVKLVCFARERAIGISMRGQAHSGYGQSQARSGIVIDSSTLSRIHRIGSDEAVVDSGVQWRTLIAAGAEQGVTPPVLTDYQGLSVGGTLSLGGLDSGPMRYGAIIDNVRELEVVTGEGDLLTCSPTRRRRLFRSVLGGLGQCGIIVRATLRMVPAPTMALLVRLRYEDVRANHADLAMLVRSGRLNAFEQLITFQDGRWVIDFQGAAYFDPPNAPDTARLLDGLHDLAPHRVVGPIPYLAWTLRFDPIVAATRDDRRVPFNLLVPEETAADFLADEILSRPPAEIGDRMLQAAGTSVEHAHADAPHAGHRAIHRHAPVPPSQDRRRGGRVPRRQPHALRPRREARRETLPLGRRPQLHTPGLGATLRRQLAAARTRQAELRPSRDPGPRARDLQLSIRAAPHLTTTATH